MKKILLSLSLLFSFQFAVAQGLEILDADTVIYGNAFTASDLVAHVGVRNGNSSAVDVKVRRRFNSVNGLTDSNAICWVVCFDTETDTSLTTITLNPGERNDNDFSGHVYPDQDGVIRNGVMSYIFYDINNPSDSAVVKIRFKLTADFSVNEQRQERWNVYPNPANEFLYFSPTNANNSNDARFVLTDMLGKVVKRVELNNQMEKSRLSVQDLNAGVYIYAIYNGNTLVEKKKLIISRR